ncbi:MAG: Bax inhibitor-1/YccA family protein [Candidatus Nanopelagicaceae bacterium]
MESSNPILSRYARNGRGYASMGNPNVGTTGYSTSYDAVEGKELEDIYNAPAASPMQTGRMTMDDVVTRTAMLFGLLVVTSAFAWQVALGGVALFGSFAIALVLGMVIAFSRKVRPALILVYAGLQGVVLGSISRIYEAVYPGIVSQALLATAGAFVGVLFAYRTGRIRITARATKFALAAIIGYLVLGIINIFGGNFIFNGTFGPFVALFGVGLATFFLAMDFDQAAKAVAIGVPQQESWRVGFGMMVSVIWLYLEVLRLLSILRRD